MVRALYTLAATAALLLVSPAHAGGKASPPPPKAPQVDFSALPEGATATPPPPAADKPHPVVARLLLEKDALVPGEKARIGVHLTQAEGWHTYWSSPGDIGQPTEIAWTASE